ncbi:2-oxo-4-hydroxy-4-carboxy-5-ureidoimidazoline decarboxylase [Streptomyces yunnanensis]|uniref:2-oxo-4-hydroxy-4-carboxy-5-ureidoimidazoline decarboxylase n=1 Tax=Streptomyces yunnanensis TaxID=156453 RepID=UPI003D9C60CB
MTTPASTSVRIRLFIHFAPRVARIPPVVRRPSAPSLTTAPTAHLRRSHHTHHTRLHPPEEPTLSGDTPAVRPTARPQPPAPRCGIPWQNRLAPAPAAGLDRFHALPHPQAVVTLLTCCGCLRWAERLADHRPYPDPESLLAAGDEASYDLTSAEQVEALAQEAPAPLPPARPGPGTLAAHTALRAAHAAYELRFRHAFVICLDGYRPDELMDQTLHAIRTRLAHEPDEERSVAAEELRRLAHARLARLAAGCP